MEKSAICRAATVDRHVNRSTPASRDKTFNRCLTSSKVLLHRVSTCSRSRSERNSALEYDLYAPASFVKFKGSDEVHGSICSKQHFPMGASPVFDDEDAYGLFAQFCMKLNVFTLVLSAIA